MPRNEVEAAYFTLLRARDELAGLQRHAEYLGEEARRLRRFQREGEALADTVDRRLTRHLRHTDQPLADAIGARLAVIADEQARLPDRIAAAEAFVDESERSHSALKRGV